MDRPGRFLHSALASFGVQDTLDFFDAEGVATKVEETGKIFPVSNKAADVLERPARSARSAAATLCLGGTGRSICRQADAGFQLTTPHASYSRSGSVILTTGGQSYPGSGTTGDGYGFAAQLGHTIVPPRPALVPITVAVPWVAELRGVTLPTSACASWTAGKVLSASGAARCSSPTSA